MTDEPLMSVKGLAEYLQVDLSTLHSWSQWGQIPAMKVVKMWRYRRSEIEEWLKTNNVVNPLSLKSLLPRRSESLSFTLCRERRTHL